MVLTAVRKLLPRELRGGARHSRENKQWSVGYLCPRPSWPCCCRCWCPPAPPRDARIGVAPTVSGAGGPKWAGLPAAMQDVFVTELVDRGMTAASVKAGGSLDRGELRALRGRGFRYVLTSVLAGKGRSGRGSAKGRGQQGGGTLNARLIDTSTGEVVWAKQEPLGVSVFGMGGGVDDLKRVARPLVRSLVGSLKAANL